MSVKYHKLIMVDGKLAVAPPDFTGRHELVLVRTIIAGVEVRQAVAAFAHPVLGTQQQTTLDAEGKLIYGLPSRAPYIEEAILWPNRNIWPSAPKEFFPDIEDHPVTWTLTPDAEDPAEYAWAFGVGDGDAFRDHRSLRGHVRACCPSQDLWALGELP